MEAASRSYLQRLSIFIILIDHVHGLYYIPKHQVAVTIVGLYDKSVLGVDVLRWTYVREDGPSVRGHPSA